MKFVSETTIKYDGLDIKVREYDNGFESVCVLEYGNTKMYCDDTTDRNLRKFVRSVRGEQKV